MRRFRADDWTVVLKLEAVPAWRDLQEARANVCAGSHRLVAEQRRVLSFDQIGLGFFERGLAR